MLAVNIVGSEYIVRAARNDSGERSGVSPLVPRFCNGKVTDAARQFSPSCPRGV